MIISHRKTCVTCEIIACADKTHNLHKSITRPLGEECKRSNDTHSAAISRRLEQGSPTNIRCYILIEINRRFDFLEFVLYERIIALWGQILPGYYMGYVRIPVSVVERQRLKSLVFPKFGL